MLSIIKQYIREAKPNSFMSYYNEYIKSIQDLNIEKELSYLISVNDLTAIQLSKLIDQEITRLNKYGRCK